VASGKLGVARSEMPPSTSRCRKEFPACRLVPHLTTRPTREPVIEKSQMVPPPLLPRSRFSVSNRDPTSQFGVSPCQYSCSGSSGQQAPGWRGGIVGLPLRPLNFASGQLQGNCVSTAKRLSIVLIVLSSTPCRGHGLRLHLLLACRHTNKNVYPSSSNSTSEGAFVNPSARVNRAI